MNVLSASFEEYRPKNIDALTDEDLHDRAVVVSSTLRWWHNAHRQNSEYHEQFRGYCPYCQESYS